MSFFSLFFTVCTNCPDTANFKFDYSSINSKYIKFTGERPHGYEYLNTNLITDSVYGLEIKVDYIKTTFNNIKFYPFISNSYALTCLGDRYIPNNEIELVKIFTLNNFDESHLKESEITEYFEIPKYDEKGRFTGFTSFQLKNFKSDYIEKEYLDSLRIIAFTCKKPTFNNLQKFRIEATLTNDTKLICETPEVTF